jgi:predicted nucleotidyltransferase
MARETEDRESDIDLLVSLGEPFDYFVEMEALIDLLYDLQLDSNRYLSARPVRARDFDAGRIQLYRNAREEGITV